MPTNSTEYSKKYYENNKDKMREMVRVNKMKNNINKILNDLNNNVYKLFVIMVYIFLFIKYYLFVCELNLLLLSN